MEEISRKRIVQLTGFRDVDKEELIEPLFKLDCIFIDSEKFENCTHLIAKKPSRSEKWLAACASGKWVLTKDYIINSAESGRWLDETTYEWGYKIERDTHYSPQMQSAPKRWREYLTCTGSPGAFWKWKVALLVNQGHKQMEPIVRVLKAGHAILCNPGNCDEEATHVFLDTACFHIEQEKKVCDAPYYSVQYIGTYLLEEPVEGILAAMTEEQAVDIQRSIWNRFCFAQARHHHHHNCINKSIVFYDKDKMKSSEIGRVSLNRIEELIEGHFFIEALGELEHLFPSLPPVHFLQSLLKYLLQGNINITCLGRFFDIFCNLLQYHPPWESSYMLQYYLDFLQCPLCRKGTWSFIEVLVRSFLNDNFCLCHKPSDLEMEIDKWREVVASILKFVAKVMQEEAKALSIRVCESTDGLHRAILPSLITGIFWSDRKAMKILTNQLSTLTDLVLRSYKETCHTDNVFSQEVSCCLSVMLGSAVEYWILLGFYLDKNLIHQVANDLAFYICVPCEDFSLEEKENFILSITSPWLQMFVTEVIFKSFCLKNNINISSEPLSLEKLFCSYIPALWRVRTCGNEKVLKRKRKIGQRPCLESQKALLMLNGENQNQDEVLFDLPVLRKLSRKSEGGSFYSKENLPSPGRGLLYVRQNTKGETALHTACRNNKVKKLSLLLSLPGTDINAKDNAGWTPLHEACNHGSTECVREILQRCPDVDLLSHVDGVTPLHDALLNGHVEIAKMLLQYGGPLILQHKDSFGKFPLDYIASPQLKKELFNVVQLNETIEDFHKQAALEHDNQNIEFAAFLLSRMLLNFHSLYGLPSNSQSAKTFCPKATTLNDYIHSKRETTSFTHSFVVRCIENIVTMQKLSNFTQTIPDTLTHTNGLHLQILLTVIHTMISP